MDNKSINQQDDQLQIVKCIFKGMTIPQMANNLHCSKSTISYQINLLYSKYKAKSRNEFILNVFMEIISNYKRMLNEKNERIQLLEKDIEEIKNMLLLLSSNRNNPGVFDYWSQEAKRYIS